MMHSIYVVGSAGLVAIVQCSLLVRLGKGASISIGETVALCLTVVLSSVILFDNIGVASSLHFWLICIIDLSIPCTWLLALGRAGVPKPFHQASANLHGRPAIDASSETSDEEPPYAPLAEGQIRLLRFSDNRTSDDDALHFELLHAKLSQRPQYVALSYSWGQKVAQGSTSIVVNSRSYEVSCNLADALRKLKQHNISTVWVDAICINQQDTVEKSREIVRMFAIYRMAEMVAVWLGSDTGPEEEIEQLAKVAEELQLPVSKQRQSSSFDSELRALERLLSQPYWNRVWVIQEVAAARQAQIFWGSYIFDLRSLETLMHERQRSAPGPEDAHDHAEKVVSVRAACRAQQKPRLMDILAMTSTSSTSVLRDKVYGLLGLASDWADFVQEPNYSQDVSEDSLCLEMTSNHIIWYSSADIIYLKSTHPHQETLPSWCPDYFHFQPHEFDENLIPYVCGRNANLGWERRRAFGQESPTMNEVIPSTFYTSGSKLTLKGRCIGRVSALGSLLDEEQTSYQLNEHLPAWQITDPDIGKAFRRLLLICHNQTFGIQPSSSFFSLLFALPDHGFLDRGYMKLKGWLDSHRAFFESFGVNLSPSSDEYAFIARRGSRLSPSSKVLPEWREFFSMSEDNTISRRGDHPLYSMLRSMFSMLEERMRLMFIGDQVLLGWAHRDAELGDTVWQLEGCTLQAILRKSEELSKEYGEDIYRLIGHAYVDPVMASGRWMAKETRSRLVRLC